jgi:N-acetyl-gamma-glutamyl-phosphate reductase
MKVSIVGATAYTSRELIKLLLRHPEAEIVHLGGRREGSPPIAEIFPELEGLCDMRLSGLEPGDAPEEPDLAFFTLPHGVAHRYVPLYREAGVRCVDFSADYRLAEMSVYEEWYGEHGDPERFGKAAYGIPELFADEITGSDLVANPGCYPTGVVLALAPLMQAEMVHAGQIVVDAKSGVSGRGNKPNQGSMYCECNEDVRAYSVAGHRHEPEMERALLLAGAPEADVTFVPHLVPMDRGILSTITAPLTDPMDTEQLHKVLVNFYSDAPFVRVRTADDQPRTKSVAFTNFCDIAGAVRRGRRVVLTAAIDNLMKGAASQAVQNMNVMFGLDQTAGLL